MNLFIDGPIKISKSKEHSIYDVFTELGGFCVSVTSVLTIISTFYINKQYNTYVARKIRRQLILESRQNVPSEEVLSTKINQLVSVQNIYKIAEKVEQLEATIKQLQEENIDQRVEINRLKNGH